jgi:hypothetical protein
VSFEKIHVLLLLLWVLFLCGRWLLTFEVPWVHGLLLLLLVALEGPPIDDSALTDV